MRAVTMTHQALALALRTLDPRIATALASSLAALAAVIAAFGGNAIGGACLLAPKPKRPRYNNSACLAVIGVTNAWADSTLSNHTYEHLAGECHSLFAFDAIFVRPLPKSATTHSTPESVFIKPQPDNLVSVIDNHLDNFNEAIKKKARARTTS